MAVRTMLDDPNTRLVTLTGAGGIGKTRLALEVAGRLRSEFAHGACFVPLASVRDPELVPAAVGQALDLQAAGDQSPSELVAAVLRQRHLLLVLDNLEHVVDAAAWVSDLQTHCPRVTALVTSRIALRVAGEQRFLVPPLPLPDPQEERAVERIAQSAAVKLFMHHARSIRSDFALTDDNVEYVHQICRALDGLPLAIELAAARITVLSPAELLGRLTDHHGVLASGGRNAPERHRTMSNAIGWSYDLLSAPEQRLFRRLSVFVAGCSLDAAEFVGAYGDAVPHEPVLETISSLVDHSLVRHVAGKDDDSRFMMLEPIREFSLDQMSLQDEVYTARDAHAGWYLHLARTSELAMQGPEQVMWLNRLEQEHDNIRIAMTWLAEQERVDEALDLAGSVWFFRWIRGFYAESRQQFERLLAHPMGAERTIARAKALIGVGIITSSQGDADKALGALEEAISIFREHDAPRYLARALLGHGAALLPVGRNEEAHASGTESLAIARDLDYAWVVAGALCTLGIVAAQQGDTDLAWSHMQECADLCRMSGNYWGLSMCSGNLGNLAMAAGDVEQAERHWQESVALDMELGSKRGLPYGLVWLADVDRYHGHYAAAESRLQEALIAARNIGEIYMIGNALIELGQVAAATRAFERAVLLLRESIEAFSPLKNEGDLAHCLDAFADLAIATREMERAARFIGAADAMLDRCGQVRIEILPNEHQGRMDAIVDVLGEQGFREAWHGGTALSQSKALEEATVYEPVPAMMIAPGVSQAVVPGPTHDLSMRELEVLKLMADGHSNQEIADRLFVSRRTAATHAASILGKLGLGSRTAAVAFAIRNGLA